MPNSIWTQWLDITKPKLQEYVSMGIRNVLAGIGYPNPSQFPQLSGILPKEMVGIEVSKNQVQGMKQLFAEVHSDLKLWAWLGTWSEYGGGQVQGDYTWVELADPNNRATLIDVHRQVLEYGFDGIADDTEATNEIRDGGMDAENKVDYWNELGAMCHSIGKPLYTNTGAIWWNFNHYHVKNLVNVDILGLAPDVQSGQATFNTNVLDFMANAQCPISLYLPNLAEHSCGMLTEIQWMTELPTFPLLIGYTLYDANPYYLTAEEKQQWIAWVKSNDNNSPPDPEPDPNSMVIHAYSNPTNGGSTAYFAPIQPKGTTLELKAFPATNYQFKQWVWIPNGGYPTVIGTTPTLSWQFWESGTIEADFEVSTVNPPAPPNGCFIATAAGMTPEQLEQLRSIRNIAKLIPEGRELVQFYYDKAFKYVPLVEGNPELKKDIHDALELVLKGLNKRGLLS